MNNLTAILVHTDIYKVKNNIVVELININQDIIERKFFGNKCDQLASTDMITCLLAKWYYSGVPCPNS